MGTFYISSPELSYVHVPRTGMAMKKIIRDWLKPNFDLNDQDSWMIDHPNLQMVRERIPTGRTLTVVRNPWQRIFSFYRKISDEGYWLDWNNQTLLDLKSINEWVKDYCNPDVEFTFPRWFNRFTNQVDFINYDGHWVDYILKAETLADDFKPIQDYLGCDKPLPDISGYDHYEFLHHFNSESIQLLAKVFERDIDLFEYTISK